MSAPSAAESKEDLLFFLLFLFLGLSLYSSVIFGEFCSDDYLTIVRNPAVRHLAHLPGLWDAFNTRFITGVTFAVNYAFGGLSVVGYHLANIFLHVLNAFLVFSLIKGLIALQGFLKEEGPVPATLRWIPVFAALIFLCHPLQTQAVSYITQRAVLLGTFFYLSALLFFVKARQAPGQASRLYGVTAMTAAALGFFSKEMTITLPVTLTVYEFFFFNSRQDPLRKRLSYLFPFWLLAALPWLALQIDRHGSVLQLREQLAVRPFSWPYFLTEANVLVTYLRLFLFPVGQNHDYDYPLAQSLLEPRTLFSLGVLITLWGVAAFLVKGKKERLSSGTPGFGFLFKPLKKWGIQPRVLSFLILWFFITTAVEFVVVCFVQQGVIYEHWVYLASVGVLPLLVMVLALALRNRGPFLVLSCILVCVCCVLTWQRNKVWQNEIVFWEDIVRKSPRRASANFGLGVALERKGFLAPARFYYKKVLELNPGYSEVYLQLGNMAFREKDLTQAQQYFETAINVNPVYAKAYYNLGVLWATQNQLDRAEGYFQKTLSLHPRYAKAYDKLGLIYYRRGDLEKAESYFQKAVALEPAILSRYEGEVGK